jgi:hypothetical protein
MDEEGAGMINLSRFTCVNGVPVEEEVLNWAEGYFYTLMNIFSAFFTRVEVAETVERISLIPFDELVREELEGESPEIIQLAIARVQELVAMELEVMQAYIE